MKKLFVLLQALIITFGFDAGNIPDENAQTLLKKIKLTDNDAKSIIFSDIAGPSFYFPGIRELKSIDEMKTARSEVPADQKSFYDETIKMMEEQLKEIDNPDNPMFSPEMD